MTEDEAMRRLSANEVACYRWPDDTSEHKALRAAFMDGAVSAAPTTSPEPDAVREDRWSDALSAINSISANPVRAGQHLDIRIVGPGCSVTLLELDSFRELVARARLACPIARNDRVTSQPDTDGAAE